MSNITILGLGAMGSRMAANLMKAGHQVTVWNRSREKAAPLVDSGATAVDTPRAAVAEAEFVISMVRDDEASRQVWLDESTGALAGMPSGAIAIESSTLTVAWVKELAQDAQASGTAFVDAPVAGSRPQAEAAQLVYYVGGDTTDFAKVEPLLQTMGSAVHHAGTIGSGAAIKLMINALFGVQLAAMGELIGLMDRVGVDPAKAVEIVASGAVASPAAAGAAKAMLAENFAPMFPIELVEKDFSYVVGTAQAADVQVPLAQAAQAIFADAIQEGYGDDNITGIVQLYLSSHHHNLSMHS